MRSAKVIGFVAIKLLSVALRGVNLCDAAFPPSLEAASRPGAPLATGAFSF
jgi:hypothetical protein